MHADYIFAGNIIFIKTIVYTRFIRFNWIYENNTYSNFQHKVQGYLFQEKLKIH